MLLEKEFVKFPCRHCGTGTNRYYLYKNEEEDDEFHLTTNFVCLTYDTDEKTLYRGGIYKLKRVIRDLDMSEKKQRKFIQAAKTAFPEVETSSSSDSDEYSNDDR